jgi:hypothetical protein
MKLSTSQRRELERMFVRTINGKRIVCPSLTTNATQTTLATLHGLTRKGVIDYEDSPLFARVFGVKAWEVKLTDAGRTVLETA